MSRAKIGVKLVVLSCELFLIHGGLVTKYVNASRSRRIGGAVMLLLLEVIVNARWQQTAAVPNAVRRKAASLSRYARLVCSSGIVTHRANTSIGRLTKNYVSYGPPSYVTRRYSKILRRRRTVQSASYQCQYD